MACRAAKKAISGALPVQPRGASLRHTALLAVAAFFGCQAPPSESTSQTGKPVLCRNSRGCGAGRICFHGRCTSATPPGGWRQPHAAGSVAPPQQIRLSPGTLSFGEVAVGQKRRFAISIENAGPELITIRQARLTPPSAPFRIETLGSGPFWVRPGAPRDIFITFMPVSSAPVEATLHVATARAQTSARLHGNR